MKPAERPLRREMPAPRDELQALRAEIEALARMIPPAPRAAQAEEELDRFDNMPV